MNTTAPIADQLQERRRIQEMTKSWTAVTDDNGALMGWITETDYPAGQWVAIFPDLDDTVNVPQLPKRWSDSLPDATTAEAHVQTNYSVWTRKQAATAALSYAPGEYRWPID